MAWDMLGLASSLAPMKESQYAVSSPEVREPDLSRKWLAFSDKIRKLTENAGRVHLVIQHVLVELVVQ